MNDRHRSYWRTGRAEVACRGGVVAVAIATPPAVAQPARPQVLLAVPSAGMSALIRLPP